MYLLKDNYSRRCLIRTAVNYSGFRLMRTTFVPIPCSSACGRCRTRDGNPRAGPACSGYRPCYCARSVCEWWLRERKLCGKKSRVRYIRSSLYSNGLYIYGGKVSFGLSEIRCTFNRLYLNKLSLGEAKLYKF